MSRIARRLAELGVVLPDVPVPHANYVPAKQVGNLVYTAGQPSHGYLGKLGDELDEEGGKAATRVCAVNCDRGGQRLTTLVKVSGDKCTLSERGIR